MYLLCFTSSKPHEWVLWLPWAEFCYNTSLHASTRKTPFEMVYGRSAPNLVTSAPNLVTYVPSTAKVEVVDQTLPARDQTLRDLRSQLQQSQAGMQLAYDKGKMEKDSQLVLERVGAVACRLDLPPGTKIHPVFNVSLLKKQLSVQNTVDSSLSIMSKDSGFLHPQPTTILNSCQRGCQRELLIHWQGLPATNAMWEEEDSFKARFPDFTSP
ncbi:hypothetical protein Patl1_05510 [Pistacia atlantica]|uniref:Uncharacterized protein n=1 Tax=Pistacia atlantica TaxID=434234 RepID=A0ACC1BVV5_9ROSI|nr:hypothetical protein Patl1_05510 [Pistacia atlantica]